MGNLIASGQNPGTEYQPAETDGVYHEDREVTVSGSPGSQMYRTYNAQFEILGSTWSIQTPGLPAYATVQNPDGSIHYLTSPAKSTWLTSEWVGNGNNAVYNGVDFGMNPGNSDNSDALQAALDAAIVAGGGKVFIPSGIYKFKQTVSRTALGNEDVGIIIEGTAGTELVADFEATGGKLLSFENFGTRGNGIRIRNLRISYATSRHHQAAGPAIYVKDCENVSVDQVYFADCPGAFVDDGKALQCGLADCTIDYAIGANDQVMVVFTRAENYIHNCIIRQAPLGPQKIPTNCTGIEIRSASEPYITNTHISDFDTGVSLVGEGSNPIAGHFSNLGCQSNVSSVSVVPAASEERSTRYSSTTACSRSRTTRTRSRPASRLTRPAGPTPTSRIFISATAYGTIGAAPP